MASYLANTKAERISDCSPSPSLLEALTSTQAASVRLWDAGGMVHFRLWVPRMRPLPSQVPLL